MNDKTDWKCKYCPPQVEHGPHWPAFNDFDAQAQHLEIVHHLPAVRDSETVGDCMRRFAAEQPNAGVAGECQCPACTTGSGRTHTSAETRTAGKPF